MSRFKTFSIFLILVVVWALFFASIKFFLLGELSTTIEPDLQQIAGYLSLWWVGAYLIGGAFAQTFLKRYYLFIVALFSFFFVLFAYTIGFQSDFIFAGTVIFIGFLYGLWNVMKSVIISVEIKKTWLPETAVTAIVGMIFVVCIIIGSLIWSIIYEQLGHSWYLVLLSFLAVAAITPFFLDYQETRFSILIKDGWWAYFLSRKKDLQASMRSYIPDLKYIIKNYLSIIVASSILWSISSVISQASVEYSAKMFDMKLSEATMILLFSALGAIIGGFLSIKMHTRRWFFFFLFGALFALSTLLIPILGTTFTRMSILATILGMCFGTSVNLSDSYLLRRYGDENKKEYGASTQWLIFSSILFLSMFLSSRAIRELGYEMVMYIFAAIILIISGSLYFIQSKKIIK